MMTDKLENYIRDNRSSFDDLTPSTDLWDHISKNNNTNQTSKAKRIIYRLSGVAATLIIALLGYNYFFTSSIQQNTFSEYYKEVLETEQYYNHKVLTEKEKIFKLTTSQPDIKRDIEAELALLDTAMIELKKDLNENISNADVVEALIQNYRMKLQILEDILIYLEPKAEEDTLTKTSKI